MLCYSTALNLKKEKIFRENQDIFLEKAIHNISDSDNPLNKKEFVQKTLSWNFHS